jgi:hypothetical protein
MAIPGSQLPFSHNRPRPPVAAFAGPKLRFGFRRLTQLSYTGPVRRGISATRQLGVND